MTRGGERRQAGATSHPLEDRTAKICAGCGRSMQWRKAWRANWAELRYCQAACRRRDPKAAQLRAALLALGAARGLHATFCPSEAARQVFGAPDAWPAEVMERTRRAARLLIAEGALVMLQGGQVVALSRAKGPVRLRQRGSIGK